MADPVSMMAVASLGMTALGGAAGAFGSITGGMAQKGMYNYQSRVAQFNAGVEANNAIYAQQSGEVKAQRAGIATAERVGMERAGAAAGGLDTGSGSAKQVRASTTEVGQFDEATIRNTAAREAYGFNVKGTQDIAQANLDVAAGTESVTSGDIGAVSSILGAGTSVSTKWAQYGNAGILPTGET